MEIVMMLTSQAQRKTHWVDQFTGPISKNAAED